MILQKKNCSNKTGFTLIETLVGSAIFILVALSAYGAFTLLINATSASRAKVSATELANERFEIIRNLPYSDVGIVGGLPVGKIVRTQNITRDGYSFTVLTTIRSVDDPFDGTIGGSPADTSPADYKLADLDITCSNCKNLSPLNFTTLVAPAALETGSTNGALFIRVIDANGNPVTSASVHIVNTHTTPSTVIDETTDNTGWVKIVDAPPGTSAYNITATKTGYSQDQTYPAGGAAGTSPVKPDSTVVAQQVTQITFSIDKLSSLTTTTVDVSCVPVPSIGFSLTGTKLIGTPAVLKYPAHSFTTDTTGNYLLSNLEWDTYSPLLTSASYDLAGINPLPLSLSPNTNGTLKIIAIPHGATVPNMSLLVTVKDSSGIAVDGASVTLTKNGGGTPTPNNNKITASTGACPTPGQVFWNGLNSGTYTLTVSKTGYTTYTNNSFSISTAWQNKIVTLP